MSNRKSTTCAFSDDESNFDTDEKTTKKGGKDTLSAEESVEKEGKRAEEEDDSTDNEGKRDEVATVDDHKKPLKQIYELFESLTPSSVKIFPKGGYEYLFQVPPKTTTVPGPPKKESKT